jgi:hypothetical protein
VWVKPEAQGAINPPTSAERLPRVNGRVSGSMRLACQVVVSGDVVVHTRSGGPAVRPNAEWAPSEEPSKWKERWEKRHEGGADEGEDDGEAKPAAPKKAAAAKAAAPAGGEPSN